MEYASFERARVALEHKEPDRLPFDLGGTLVSAVNVKTLRELRKHVRLPEHAEVCDKVTEIVPDADVMGTQKGLFVSFEMYKKMIWPFHRNFFEFIKKNAKSRVYVFFHCDGDIREVIPLLIEAGVDILNPVQVNCPGMADTRALKREFGRDLTFWGGSCDSQSVLPFGTPAQVREETRRRIEDLAPGGGFVFAPIHVIQAEVPAENIMAWRKTLQTFGCY
jgi:uroporphyrinogen decarboxylase